jgi:hypothetical protein
MVLLGYLGLLVTLALVNWFAWKELENETRTDYLFFWIYRLAEKFSLLK